MIHVIDCVKLYKYFTWTKKRVIFFCFVKIKAKKLDNKQTMPHNDAFKSEVKLMEKPSG